MPTYDNRLADWFKQVEKQEQELKAKKKTEDEPPQQEHKSQSQLDENSGNGSDAHHVTPADMSAAEIAVSKMVAVDTEYITADADLLEDADTSEESDPASASIIDRALTMPEAAPPVDLGEARRLFEEEEEGIDDFLSFISKSAETEQPPLLEPELTFEAPEETQTPESIEQSGVTESEPAALTEPEAAPEPKQTPEPEPQLKADPTPESRAAAQPTAPKVAEQPSTSGYKIPENQRKLDMCEEGTGDPLPVSELLKLADTSEAQAPAEPVEPVAEVTYVPTPEPAAPPQPVMEQAEEARPESPKPTKSAADSADAQAGWDRMPAHLHLLFSDPSSEVAQNSYKTFKESRSDLIQRLLDPIISLEDAARILNVCPTTVRRYTNRGVLKHIRTAGNQRRFRLSDVLTFMESNARRGTRKRGSGRRQAEGE